MASSKWSIEDIRDALVPVLGGEATEVLTSLLLDPTAYYTPGVLGAAWQGLRWAAEYLEEEGKEAALVRMSGGKLEDNGYVFSERPARVNIAVDTAKIRKLFPPKKHPELYREQTVKGGVVMQRARERVSAAAAEEE